MVGEKMNRPDFHDDEMDVLEDTLKARLDVSPKVQDFYNRYQAEAAAKEAEAKEAEIDKYCQRIKVLEAENRGLADRCNRALVALRERKDARIRENAESYCEYIDGLEKEIEQYHEYIKEVEASLAEKEGQVKNMAVCLGDKKAQVTALKRRLAEKDLQLAALKGLKRFRNDS